LLVNEDTTDWTQEGVLSAAVWRKIERMESGSHPKHLKPIKQIFDAAAERTAFIELEKENAAHCEQEAAASP
jgi:hypothetical protein